MVFCSLNKFCMLAVLRHLLFPLKSRSQTFIVWLINVESSFENVSTGCHCLSFFFEEKQEDQARRNSNPNLQVRKTQCYVTSLYPGPRNFILILCFFYLEIRDTKRWSKLRPERKESLWSRSLRISLSCWLSTWQLSKMSFSFDQSHPQRYLIHPIIWHRRAIKNIL